MGDLYQETVGDGHIFIAAGPQKLRLEVLSGDVQELNLSKLDQVIFVSDPTPVTPMTWGKIKSLYKN